jgi:hypothetical protein
VIVTRAGIAALCLAGALGVVASRLASAQSPREWRVAEGRVTLATNDGRPVPVAGQWVVLHRVGSDRSAPLDSMRTDRAGRYRIRYERSGDPEALYFVSARYDGIAHFSSPLRAPTVRGGDADIMVFGSTSDTTQLRVQGRHLVVSAARADGREVAEIFEIENAGYRTVIARDSGSPAWSSMLPALTRNPSIAPGDLTAGAVTFRGGRAQVYAPISPGVRQIAMTYELPPNAFPLTIPMGRAVSVLEVLLEEPRAIVEGAGLGEVEPAAIDGRMFRRFLAQNVPANAVIRVSAPAPVEQNRTAIRILGGLVAAGLIAGLAAWYVARRHRRQTVRFGPKSVAVSDALIAQLATLDARYDDATATAVSRAAYEQERAQLKDRIARALAAENAAA